MNQVLKEEVQGTATILDRAEKSDKKLYLESSFDGFYFLLLCRTPLLKINQV